VELRPRYLKLDASLIRHADRDPARQAMIAGMQQFAARIGCQVLAEGIELPAELDALRELGVPLGQGFLLTTAAGRGDAPSARKPGPVPRRRAARSGSSCRRTVTGTESRPRNGSSRSA
jgi:EAL domain-containing protein (putative c-di-GMP-specific phosphodiesterase class I)